MNFSFWTFCRGLLLLLSVTASTCFPHRLAAQLRLDDWQTYTSMHNVTTTDFDSRGVVWSGTSGGVFSYDPSTGSYQVFRNIDALLSIDITALRVQPGTDVVFAGCSDGIINVYSGSSWEYITDIKAKADDFSSVRINDFLFDGTKVLIAGDFGIAVYHTETRTFGITITNFNGNRNINIYNLLAAQDRIWAATSAGVFSAPLHSEQLNLPSIWQPYVFDNGGTQLPVARGLAEHQGSIYTGSGKDLWKLADDTFVSVARMDTVITGIVSTGTALYMSDLYRTIQFPDRVVYNQASGNNSLNGIALLPASFPEPVGLLLTQKGLGYLSPGSAVEYIVPNSPQSNLFMDMAVATDGSLWAATIKDFAASGFFRFHEGTWTNFTRDRYPAIQSDAYVQINTAPDGSIWASSWGAGAAHLVPQADTFAITLYDTSNSPIKGIGTTGGAPDFEVMGETVTDANGVTWILNHIEQKPRAYLIARDNNGTFYTFPPPTSLGIGSNWFYNYIAIDAAGTKWLGSLAGNQIIYFNDRGTLSDQSDDVWGRVDASNTSLTTEIVNGLAVDKSGAIWFATNNGVYVIDNPSAVLTQNRLFSRGITVIPSQFATCIMVDALNRKWVGTNTGVWILSADGTSVVDNITSDNTPLLENAITSLATDESTGKIYIGSRSGMNSVLSYAVRANLDFNSLRCFPQPFIPSVDPELVVDGLAERSLVKISTVDGDIVRTIQSNGSRTVVWDGRDETGELVPSGVYIVSGFSETSGETGVAKAMVIRRE